MIDTEIDREFAKVITSIADLRTANRKSANYVEHLFKPMTDHLSLFEMREYIAGRFPLKRGKDLSGNHEYTFIEESQLKRFFRLNRLVLGFRNNSDWTAIIRFHASLGNGQV